MLLSVVIPSRLQSIPVEGGPFDFWLERAVASVRAQQGDFQFEILVGHDSGVATLALDGVRYIDSGGTGQPRAMNAAAHAATGEVIAFLEDDDVWMPAKTRLQLALLEGYDLVTSCQGEVDVQGRLLGLSDYPTPSGWMMRRKTWADIGHFDEALRFHIDNDWLGRANKAELRRCHIVTFALEQAPTPYALQRLSLVSEVRSFPRVRRPLVLRTTNPEGGMAKIAQGGAEAGISQREHDLCILRYGETPW